MVVAEGKWSLFVGDSTGSTVYSLLIKLLLFYFICRYVASWMIPKKSLQILNGVLTHS
jgi:hypothetical protein